MSLSRDRLGGYGTGFQNRGPARRANGGGPKPTLET